jgi:hypothetical protein
VSGEIVNMSKVEELLQNIFEYKNLLLFLNKNHPQVLEEWKIFAIEEKDVMASLGPQQQTDTTNPGVGDVT